MAKDPAFLFYPNDWLGGTIGMTFEEKGAYMELLMVQFNRGHMTSHMIAQTVGHLWDKIKDKFKEDDAGRFYNERLEYEVNRRKAFAESRRNNLSGKNQYSKKKANQDHIETHMNGHMTNICKSYDQHMENEIENRNEIKNVVIKGGMGGNDLSNELTPLEIGKAKEYIEITAQRKLTEQQITEYWKAYLIHSTGEFHLNRSKQLQHFRNWLKYQNNEKSKRNSKDAWKLDGSPDIEYDPL